MPKDNQDVEIVVAEDFLEALVEALWDGEWNFEPVGFLPCLCLQQVVEELERQDGLRLDDEQSWDIRSAKVDAAKVC